MDSDYYLGLDMGTSSVGWAVTDKHYHLLRVKGKDLWGIREFEEAKTSEERRTHRVSRRRRQREIVRIGLVNSMFEDAIAERDRNFLQRLENSKYHLEDKDEAVRYKYGIFNDENYTDTDYYKQFPTVFHLRQELIKNKEPHDVRLVYLAVLNLFKRRGHFLNKGLDGAGKSMKDAYRNFCDTLNTYLEDIEADPNIQFELSADDREMEEILGDKSASRTEKAERLQKMFGVEKKNKRKVALLKLISGLTVDLKVIFDGIESEENLKISFADYNYEEKIGEIGASLEEAQNDIVLAAKSIYDTGLLSGIMRGYEYLSDARVADYEKHRSDLKLLKKVVCKYAPKSYDSLFREEGAGSYSAYVNSVNTDGQKLRRNMKGRSREDLYKNIKSILKPVSDEDADIEYILREIETETFLPKQLTASNGVIPNQVHQTELEVILENAAVYLPFLNEADEWGLTTKKKLLDLFSFQIPYYVGPTTADSERNGGNGWVVRKAEGQVLPWTLEETVDLQKTSERFIERLIRTCTYISGEKVLPKASLRYERFSVLNEINNIRIDSEKIPVDVKQDIYTDLFETGKRVTRKRLFSYLRNRGLVEEETQITGIDRQINNSLSSYGKFRAIFGDKMNEDRYRTAAEDIIFWCTIYGEDRQFIVENLKNSYSDILSEDEIKRISGFKFRDWGRLSGEFLGLQGCYKPTGEVMSILDALWSDENNSNLMELLHSELYTFGEELQKKQSAGLSCLEEFTHDDLDDMYFSAPVKRMIWQTLLVIRDLKKTLGNAPSRVFIEMTRTDDTKGDAGRKDSRRKQLETLYKNISTETPAWKKKRCFRKLLKRIQTVS